MPLKITPPAGTRTIAGRTLGWTLGTVERTAKQGVRWALGHGLPRTAIVRSARKGDLQGDLILSGPGSHTFDLVDLFDRLEQGQAGHLIAIHVLPASATEPVSQRGDIGVTESIAAPEEGLDQRGRVLGAIEDRQPRPEIGHLGHGE